MHASLRRSGRSSTLPSWLLAAWVKHCKRTPIRLQISNVCVDLDYGVWHFKLFDSAAVRTEKSIVLEFEATINYRVLIFLLATENNAVRIKSSP